MNISSGSKIETTINPYIDDTDGNAGGYAYLKST